MTVNPLSNRHRLTAAWLALLSGFALMACGAPAVVQSAARQAAAGAGVTLPSKTTAAPTLGTTRNCADKLALALASPNTLIPGAWLCQDDNVQNIATNAIQPDGQGITDDAAIERYAAEPPMISLISQCPVSGNTHTYLITTTDAAHPKATLKIQTDPDGRVSYFTLTGATTCP